MKWDLVGEGKGDTIMVNQRVYDMSLMIPGLFVYLCDLYAALERSLHAFILRDFHQIV